MKDGIILVGGGGHCKSCIDVIEGENRYSIAGIIDIQEKINEKVLGYKVFATDKDLYDLSKDYDHFLVTIGQIKSPLKRIEIYEKLKSFNVTLPIICSPTAYVSKHSQIGEGSIIMHGVCINASAKIGKNCIINNKVLIEHDATIGDHCHISTGSIVNGGVKVGNGSFLGSNSGVREYIEIGERCFVRAGTFLSKNINHCGPEL